MGLVSLVLSRRSYEKPAVPLTAASLLDTGRTSAGKAVTAEGALRISAVYACVRILAETIGGLPLPVYRRVAGGKERAPDHPLYGLLHDLPNPEMTAMELRENLVGHMCLWGTGYCEIEWSGSGKVKALWPLRADKVQPEKREGQLHFVVTLPSGERAGLPARNVWRIRNFGTGTLQGLSVIAQARETLGLAMATEEYGGRFFANDSRPGGIIKYPGQLTKEAAGKLKTSWEAAHGGLRQSHRVAVLEEGAEWQAIGVPPEDAQFLETRKFQTTEIARWFRIQPHMVGDLERATFSNIEHQGIEFVVHTIRPWLVRIEQSISRDLMMPEERRTYLAEHLVDGLLRGDIINRYQAYAVARQNGWMNADDIRNLENMNPLPDGQGQMYLVPLNMVPASEVGAGDDAPPAPTQTRALRPLSELCQAVTLRAQGQAAQAKVKAVARRRKIARSYRRLVGEAAERVLRREEADVLRQAEKLLNARAEPELLGWLDDFYRTYPEVVKRNHLPVLLSLADQIQADAAEQIGAEPGMGAEMERFVGDYADVAAYNYSQSSLGQLRHVLDRAKADDADPFEALRQRFAQWRESRPGKLATTHTVRAANAVTKETWRANGVAGLEWVTYGENCPYCNALSGRQVGMTESFLGKGEGFSPDGATTPLRPRRDIGHAPAHMGCDCGVAPT